MKQRRSRGFTLVELVLVVTIMGILASLAIPGVFGQVQLAMRTEAVVAMDATYKAQAGYHAEFGAYASTFDELRNHLTIPGSRLVSANALNTGKYTLVLAQPWGTNSWQVTATGQLDGDPWLDVVVGDFNKP